MSLVDDVGNILTPQQAQSMIGSAISTQVPPLIPPPLFRFSAPGSLVALGTVVYGAIADRTGTLASMQVRCSALVSAGSLTFQLKKNGTAVQSWNGSISTQSFDLSSLNVAIVAGDLLTIEVSAYSLVVGLGVTYGYIKAS